MAAPRRDAAATLPSLRTLGTGSTQAAAGDHGHGGAVITGTTGALGDVLTITSTSPLTATWGPVTGSGTGDVVGPSSATDNAVARFDLATGKLLQNSVLIVGDTGVVTGGTWQGTRLTGPYAPVLSNIEAPTGSVNFAQQQATSFVIENRTSDPASPVAGQIWLRTDL
jgi:hypothetical protein